MNIYTTTIHARCPFQPVWDYYALKISSDFMIQCETIEEICEGLRGLKLCQETIADSLFTSLLFVDRKGGKSLSLALSGWHGANCKVTCERSI